MIELNANQKTVITDYSGARSVVAGPGSGKTATMVELIHTLIGAGIRPADIRAVTFSKEMAQTLEKRAGVKGVVSTFHSLGYLICSETERKPVEPELRYRLMMKLIRKWGPEYKALDGFIARMRRENISPDDAAQCGNYYDYGLVNAYAEYERTRAQEGWMDFDSMLADAVALLENNQQVRARWQPQYLIVDEAQDTDDLQWRMMQLMSQRYGNITVVGDPSQCQPAGTLIRTTTGVMPIEHLENGDLVLSWTKRDQRIYQRSPRPVYVARRFYRGRLLTLTSNNQTTRVTPNHYLWVRFAKQALASKPHFVYLMWRDDLGFRIGTSTIRRNRAGGCFLSQRARQEKAQKMWILQLASSQQEAEVIEEMTSLRYQIPECMFESYNKCKKTPEQIKMIFECANPDGGYHCLRDYNLLFENPIWDKKNQHFHGYFKIVAANLIPKCMILPTEEPNGSAILDAVTSEPFCGTVYSLNVEKDHTYIADGIPVGNCIYSFRGAKPDNITNFQQWFPNGKKFYLGQNYRSTQTIVNFVRENAPPDTPKELLDRMVAVRQVKGAPIGLKMYWTDNDETESALALAQKDPLNSIILARTNRMVGLLERLCNRYNIRYHLMGKTGFWKQNEIRKAIDAVKNLLTVTTLAALNLTLPAIEAKYAVDDRTERDNDALENLHVLRVIGKDFRMVKDFVAYGNKMMHRRNDPRGVAISTVHQAKGGEWRNVYLIGVNAKGFPHVKGDPTEERRIYFVAISRAVDMLRISFAGTPSPYLRRYLTDEILDKLREHATEVDRLQEQHKLFA